MSIARMVTLAIRGLVVIVVGAGISAQAAPIIFGVDSSSDALTRIDAATGAGSIVGRLDPAAPADPNTGENRFATPVAMAVQPGTGTLYAWNNSGIAAGGTGSGGPFLATSGLVRVDAATGAGTLISPTPQPIMGALSFVGSTLFGFDDVNLYQIAPLTGLAISLGVVTDAAGVPIGRVFGADAFGATLYALTSDQKLYTVDETTLVATLIDTLNVDVDTPGSILFLPDGTLIGSAFGGAGGSILFDINPANGDVSNSRSVTGVPAPQGMGVIGAVVPIPGTLALLLCGSVGMILVRRRRFLQRAA